MGATESLSARARLRDTVVLRLHLAATTRSEGFDTYLLSRFFLPQDPTRRGYVPMKSVQLMVPIATKKMYPDSLVEPMLRVFDVDKNGFFHYEAFVAFVSLSKLSVELSQPVAVVSVFTVAKGVCAGTGMPVTVKRTQLRSIEIMDAVREAVVLLATFNHDNLLRYINCNLHEHAFELYQEWADTLSLTAVLSNFGRMGEPAIRRYLDQIIDAIVFLHGSGISHRSSYPAGPRNVARDLHGGIAAVVNNMRIIDVGENVYIDRNGRVQLGEFYVGRQLRESSSSPHNFRHSLYDTFCPPEARGNVSCWGKKADVWTIGLMLYGTAHLTRVNAANSAEPPIPHHISPFFRKLLDACFEVLAYGGAANMSDPRLRPHAHDLKAMSFFAMTPAQDAEYSRVPSSLDVTMKRLQETPLRRPPAGSSAERPLS
ncbi:hypothetical protein ACHHYP_12871 [Achlya hypogyna]|uniref:Protein kinase domain-containing protein n=1 Tax=Achlya hypogyna TaxID=1202772 RepID=A0A1V9ZFZ9_ACHHY|nr:hypothetical protein ACHHYP_12871 [Achlya hypogyna]